MKKGFNKSAWICVLGLGFVLLGAFAGHCGPRLSNGVDREYHPNGRLKSEIIYKEDLIVRKRLYHDNGRLSLEERYKGKDMTLRRWFYESGQLKSIWTAKSNITKFYYPDGRLRVEVGRPKAANRRK